MKLKVVVIDLEIPPRVKKWALRVGVPLVALMVGAAAARAGQPSATLVTWSDGQTLHAADLNANFSLLQGQITPSAYAPRTPSAFGAWVQNNTNQTFPNDISETLVFDHVDFDLAGEYKNQTGAFTPANSGVYLVSCQIEYSAPGNGPFSTVLYDNGQTIGVSDLGLDLASAGNGESPSVTRVLALKAGHTITCGGWQEADGTASISTAQERTNFAAARLY